MSSFLSGLTIGSILLGGALILIVILFLARPFAVAEDEERRIGREAVDALLLRKESLLREIRELDEDYEAAKVAPEMYQRARPAMVKQAALVMKQLDDAGYVEAAPVPANVDAQIEAAVRRLRTPEQIDAQIETAIRQARQQPAITPAAASTTSSAATASMPATNGTTKYCPQCGRRVEPDERFCARCGRNLSEEPQSSQAARA